MEKRIKVTIEDMKWIPSIGRGPIRKPIAITHDQYKLLKLLGFNVVEYKETIKVQPIELSTKEEVAEEIIEEVVDEIAEEVQEEAVEEVIEEIEEEVETVQEEVAEEEAIEEKIDVNSMTKKQLKAELDKREISYQYNATVEQLKKILSENL